MDLSNEELYAEIIQFADSGPCGKERAIKDALFRAWDSLEYYGQIASSFLNRVRELTRQRNNLAHTKKVQARALKQQERAIARLKARIAELEGEA